MRTTAYLIIVALLLTGIGTGCSQNIDDPVFDYNLKSAKVIETNNDFGLDLLKTVVSGDEAPNIMISPASVSIALGMAYNGAESTTMDAFEQVLNYDGLTREEVNEITKELICVLVTNVKGNLLEIANSMWYDKGFPVEQDFIDLNSNYYNAEIRELDFRNAGAVKTINDWVSNKTHDKIDKIIESISPETMMILINALYFNCLWEYEFDPDDTREQPFYTEDNQLFDQVEMMQIESTYNVSFNEAFSAVEMPYKNNKFSMYLFLPSEGSSVDQLIEQLDGDTWNSWMGEFTETKDFTVTMPKFKFEYNRSMKEDLMDMGLEIAFTNQADFSGISPIDLLISDVIHKTYIDVNEEGTEAAAVTAIVFENTSAGPASFIRLDRPFLFAITENTSKSILFIGKVSEPSYE
ncbi:MAG: serpin family protein [Bacteroidales bacterium]|nr:serpin family protein [Bacteroidales bacterium]